MACVPALLVILMVLCVRHSSVTATCDACGTPYGDCQGGTCFCKPGWFEHGCWADCHSANCSSPEACTAADACAACSPVCVNGECRAIDHVTVGCYCYTGYTGETCDEVDCVSGGGPCMNGATCTGGAPGHCFCTSEWTGQICDEVECGSGNGPCMNGATCTDGTPDTCTCTTGWTGQICDTAVCGGGNLPCMNGATCTYGPPDICTCTPKWTGQICDVAACDTDDPCRNGGSCVDKLCQCTEDYTGDRCQNGDTTIMASFIVFLGTATVAAVFW